MTLTHYNHSSRASTRYAATANGLDVYVWKRTTDTQFGTLYWAANQQIDQSCASIATDETVAVVVSKVGGSITTAKVYANSYSGPTIPSTVSAGLLSFSLPPGTVAWCEIDGLRGQPLIIHSKPLITQPSGPTVDIYNGSQTAAVTGRTLVFPAGSHTIGQSFQIQGNGKVWLHGEAWVIGSFFVVSDSGDDPIGGHGILSGEWGSGIRTYIRTLTFEVMVTYSLIYGPFGLLTDRKVSGITLVDPPFYSTYQGVNIYEEVTVICPWWGNANAFFTGEKWPERTARVSRCCAFSHDDVVDLAEYLGPHLFENNIFGSIASAAFIVSYWPSLDSRTRHQANNNAVVCLNYANPATPSGVGGIVLSWCDGDTGEEHHVVSGVTLSGVAFLGSQIRGRPFDLTSRKYPIEWGLPQGQAFGQIRDMVFENITFEVVPDVKSEINGLDPINTPHDIHFNNVRYAGVLLTAANFFTYFNMNGFPYNIYVNGVPVRSKVHSSGAWFLSNPFLTPFSYQPQPGRLGNSQKLGGPLVWWPTGAITPSRGAWKNAISPADWTATDTALAGTSVGTSTLVGALTGQKTLAGQANGTSSMLGAIASRIALAGISSGTSSMTGSIGKLTPIGLAGASIGSSSMIGNLGALLSLAGTSVGSSSMVGNITGGGIGLTGTSVGTSSLYGNLGIIYSEANRPDTSPMKQRIYNALLALCNNGPYFEAKVDAKSGQMTVFTSKPVKPVSVDVVELDKTFAPASRYRRAFNVAEIQSWIFQVVIQFSSGLRVSCEQFENDVTDAGITIPESKNVANQRTLLAQLVKARYDEPPAQNPSLGSVVTFTFEVVPATLRK